MATTTLKCVDCGKEFELEAPQHELVNALSVSMLVFAHPLMPCCPHCGTMYRFEIAGIKQAVFGFKKFVPETPGDASRILVPDGFDFSKLKKN